MTERCEGSFCCNALSARGVANASIADAQQIDVVSAENNVLDDT
jgi:hypothetical protein